MVNVIIDGVEYSAEEGETVLHLAKRNNIDIPTLCHHPAIPPYSACRVCVVEAKQGGRKWVAASCSLPVSGDLEVMTSSDRIIKSRKLLLELYLARCPGSEELKKFASNLGVDTTRFECYKETDERCILCGLCVNVCRESGNSTLGFIGRGDSRRIGVPFDLPSSYCLTCGACEFVCPTNCIDLSRISDREPIPIMNQFDEGLARTGAIDIPFPQAIPNVPMIDRNACNYFALFRLAFASTSDLLVLNLAAYIKSLGHSPKGTPSQNKSALTACKHTVSGSFSLPSRGSFHLSLTVLLHYRSLRSI